MRTERKIAKSVASRLLDVISPKTNAENAISSEP